ncbi:alpha/beta hydrolase [Amylibacter sp. IMCC11727]|uniref:alpha/beta fold hydrolase n=1 Tax=Amylibacter sp. IMCC11727 TaxID=3039851 RepID=UPI00244DAC7A|nr:alpha/beta hydrolase [Amylibacter sp. IMCC11727]WGI22221.1 alpha/beta hydrolase [Amylibacter sp. IMCC11727]
MKKLLLYAIYALLLIVFICGTALWASVKLRETEQLADILPENGLRVETSELTVHITPTGTNTDTPVLLIHGTGSWGGYWQETADIIAANDYYALALDVPPFGYSDRAPDGNYGRVAQANRIIATVDALGTKPIVVAHSFGASVALETVLLAPEKFAGLVIVSGAVGLNAHETGPDTLPLPARSKYVRRAGVALTSTNGLMTESLIKSFIYDKSLDVSKYATVLQQPMIRKGTTAAHADWLVDLLVPPKDALSTRKDEIAKLTMPTAFIWGDKDEVSPLDVGQTLNSLIAGSTLDVMPDIGHIPQIENSELFHKHLLGALAQISGGSE